MAERIWMLTSIRLICRSHSKLKTHNYVMGFTFLEILVVITLVVLLMGMAVPQFFAMFSKAHEVEYKHLQIVLKMLRNDAVLKSASYCLLFDLKKQQMMVSEEEPTGKFTTTGLKTLEKTFHPKTAPNFKQVLLDDYMDMQKQLGIPFEEEGVHKLFGDSGIKHIWHMYGLLACQILTKTIPYWTIKHMADLHDFKNENGNSFIDDVEFFVFMSCTRRLMQIAADKNKIFALLIFLYEEYANDNDWVTTWSGYFSMNGMVSEMKPMRFADRLMYSQDYLTTQGFTIRNSNYEWNTIYRAKEYLASQSLDPGSAGMVTFDNYIQELYFMPPYSDDRMWGTSVSLDFPD